MDTKVTITDWNNLKKIEVSVGDGGLEGIQDAWAKGKIITAHTTVKEVDDSYEAKVSISACESSTGLGKNTKNISRQWRSIREQLEAGEIPEELKDVINEKISLIQ